MVPLSFSIERDHPIFSSPSPKIQTKVVHKHILRKSMKMDPTIKLRKFWRSGFPTGVDQFITLLPILECHRWSKWPSSQNSLLLSLHWTTWEGSGLELRQRSNIWYIYHISVGSLWAKTEHLCVPRHRYPRMFEFVTWNTILSTTTDAHRLVCSDSYIWHTKYRFRVTCIYYIALKRKSPICVSTKVPSSS